MPCSPPGVCVPSSLGVPAGRHEALTCIVMPFSPPCLPGFFSLWVHLSLCSFSFSYKDPSHMDLMTSS